MLVTQYHHVDLELHTTQHNKHAMCLHLCLCAVYACGQAGLEVGQGTGFEFMVNPWLQYKGYGMKLTNNLIYDVWGAGLGVNGGYSVLIAHNTLFR